MAKIAMSMIALSTAILILSVAVTRLAKMDWQQLTKGLVGAGVIMAELALFMKFYRS